MRHKGLRFADRLRCAPAHDLYRGAHIVVGGTGAVGGTVIIKLIDFFEELMVLYPPRPNEVPVLIATGKTRDERSAFLDRVRRFLVSRRGEPVELTRSGDGWLTPSGILLVLSPFEISPFPALSGIKECPAESRPEFVREALRGIGTEPGREDVVETLVRRVGETRHFHDFLRGHLQHAGAGRFRSVLLGIPLPSLVAYTEDWEIAAGHIDGLTPDAIERLKSSFETAIRDDLAAVHGTLADEVIVAHTTSVGGMYDETTGDEGTPRRQIRLGFSHSARDEKLIRKQESAERLTHQYSERGIKVFITAAAIGIDDVLIRKEVPLQREVRRQLRDIAERMAPPATDRDLARMERRAIRDRDAIPVPHGQVRVFPAFDYALDAPVPEPLPYVRAPATGRPVQGDLLRPSYTLRSGENGVFTVANAEALYRVMRVASASELATVLATVALLGDDPQRPYFTDGVCYWTETDNSRQVFDFLAHPTLRQAQLSGLEPMALQDLGSAKHQCELHTLGLLILLHRLRTLDLDAIPPYVDASRFDPRGFFEEHSRPLTFEELDGWELETLASDLRTLATAETADDLETLRPSRTGRDDALFAAKRAARRAVLEEVIRAVRTIVSLGSPIVYEREGEARVRSGFFVAPLETVLTGTGDVARWLGERAKATGNAYEDVRDFHLCAGGFIDLRPHALVCTAKTDELPLAGRIHRARTEAELRAALACVEPYGFFCACGLLAVMFRLRSLFATLKEAMIELGTLQEFRWQMPRDVSGHILVVPGSVEAMRMVAEGLEKTTGTERIDGTWGYEPRRAPDRLCTRHPDAAAEEKGTAESPTRVPVSTGR